MPSALHGTLPTAPRTAYCTALPSALLTALHCTALSCLLSCLLHCTALHCTVLYSWLHYSAVPTALHMQGTCSEGWIWRRERRWSVWRRSLECACSRPRRSATNSLVYDAWSAGRTAGLEADRRNS